ALLRRRPSKEVAIEASFLRGQWEGFSRILAMAPRRRRELLGRAANRLQPDPATFSDRVSPEGYHSLSSGGEESTGSPAASRRGASP
ncbi:MAG TPA: hypothetical protein VFG43_11430, partial [Geminicoccaceae bacterium]|nr:hypothetical protein [Geminicoccaceae bacterium]